MSVDCEFPSWFFINLHMLVARRLGGPVLRRLSTQAVDSAPPITHDELRQTVQSFIAREINPHVDKWEADGIFPAKELFKKMGNAGLLGLTKPVENGGMGLDYSYNLVLAEELGAVNCGGVPMAIGVQTDMATPALAKFGSPALREQVRVARSRPSPSSGKTGA